MRGECAVHTDERLTLSRPSAGGLVTMFGTESSIRKRMALGRRADNMSGDRNNTARRTLDHGADYGSDDEPGAAN